VDVKTFATLLSRELLRRGIPKELAVKHAVSLVRTFDEEDLREIASYTSAEEFEDLSDSLCELIKDKELSEKKVHKTPAVPNPTIQFPERDQTAKTGEFTVPKRDTSSVPDGATKEIPIPGSAGAVSVPDGATKEIPIPGSAGAVSVPDGATKEIPIPGSAGAVSVPDGATKEIPIPGSAGAVSVPDGATKEIPIPGSAGAVSVPDGATKEIPIPGSAGAVSVPDGATKEIPIPGSAGAVSVPDGATKEIPIPGGGGDNPGLEHMKTKAFNMEMGLEPSHTQNFPSIKTSDISLRADTASDVTIVNLPVDRPSDGEEEPQEIYLDEEVAEEEEDKKVVLTPRAKAFFWGIAVATGPVWLIISLLVLSVFALGIVTVCAFIVAALLLVCAEAVAGSGLTLVGIIYGAIEIVSGNPGIGIYEIGLGICCGGLALCLGILTYNLAVLGLPYILKQLLTFEGYCLKRVGPMLERFREECNRL